MEERSTPTLEKIQQAALAEFLDKGFLGASLRQIVKTQLLQNGQAFGIAQRLEYPSRRPIISFHKGLFISNIFDIILYGFSSLVNPQFLSKSHPSRIAILLCLRKQRLYKNYGCQIPFQQNIGRADRELFVTI